jgi:purine-binding chemotaxis protein CheW
MISALLLPLGLDTYAVPLDRVREVVAGPDATPVPTAPRAVRGLINVRGEIMPLLDTGALAAGAVAESAGFGVVVGSPCGLAALVTTGLPEVAELDDPVASAEGPGALSIHAVGRRLVTLLDLEALITLARIRAA